MRTSVSPRHRLLAWLSPDVAGAAAAVEDHDQPPRDSGRGAVHRRLYDDIGDFLFRNGLAPSPANFAVAHAYISGEDWDIAQAVATHLQSGAALLDDDVARILESRAADELTPEALTQLAQTLESGLVDYRLMIGESRSNATHLGDELDREAANLDSDPVGALHRIITVTREAVEKTRRMEEQLQRSQREADQLKADLESARRAAEQDHLTGLPNRRSFERHLREALAADGPPPTLALCDIDDFKQINDRFGHPAGDRVLKFVAGFLEGQLGKAAIVSRYGGEEFACLFREADTLEARDLLDTVRERLSTRSLVNQETGEAMGSLTFSAGVAPVEGDRTAQAFHDADHALYTAKRSGKNMVIAAR
ncbi:MULTISPECIES: sensor domain-containing diguanylate cyclase [Sphingomonas]|jgi:diguanylate cyclase|uniref:diguanylate cyclase n=1 Tax=Sphingomonas ginsenosidimutans TaxID=862134 RepID=A0A2A4I122_9SPHN|nr:MULTISPECIES: GGDEF domain-containing protein [Sphingomonas]MBY0300704.1 GGDEF domain-containing protein [Sphingomonas ginsenosidimutans]MEE2916341.1 GGDEF domain-containing protein [Pseudomonadota bacterium]PCG09635.1 GGDEF domain-containing protein [Sphingomonas ginsenosidimutans]